MDPTASQKLLDQTTEIVKNANSQGWAIGLVALGCVVMFISLALMVKWFMQRESRTAAEAITREQTLRQEATQRELILREEAVSREGDLRKAIGEVDNFTRTTLVELLTKSTAAMNSVADATRGCLAQQQRESRGK